MPTWLKVVLGLTLAFVLLIGLVVGGGVLWFSKNKGQLVAMGEKATREGRAFGSGRSGPECIDEGVRRLDGTGLMDEVANRIFTSACLESASRPPGFCDGVPPKSQIMDTARWRIGACAQRPADPQKCGRLMESWQDCCFGTTRLPGPAKSKAPQGGALPD